MKGPRIGGLPSGKKLDFCQEPRHTWTVLLVYLGICALLPVTILSGWYSIVTLLSFSLRYPTLFLSFSLSYSHREAVSFQRKTKKKIKKIKRREQREKERERVCEREKRNCTPFRNSRSRSISCRYIGGWLKFHSLLWQLRAKGSFVFDKKNLLKSFEIIGRLTFQLRDFWYFSEWIIMLYEIWYTFLSASLVLLVSTFSYLYVIEIIWYLSISLHYFTPLNSVSPFFFHIHFFFVKWTYKLIVM